MTCTADPTPFARIGAAEIVSFVRDNPGPFPCIYKNSIEGRIGQTLQFRILWLFADSRQQVIETSPISESVYADDEDALRPDSF
jgi:hypothetical protein